MLIVGYHVAKTGGTTVMHHITDHLGDDAFFNYGNHPAADRFFSDKPLWEELSREARAPVRFLFGHHVNDHILADLGGRDAALFSVIRDPYTHFVSQYKYHLSVIKGEGRHVSARKYLDKWLPNRVSSEFYKFFRLLLSDPETPFGIDALYEILKQFRFLCVTEKLTEQSVEITQELGIPPIEGRHRVSKSKVDLEGITAEEVYAKSPIDLQIYHAVLARANGENGPLTFDPETFDQSLKRLNRSMKKAQVIRTAYDRLAQFFRLNDKLEAAQVHLALNETYEKRHVPILRGTPKQRSLVLRKAVARSEYEKAVVFMKHFRFPMASACFEKAITLNPDYADAYVGYAHCLMRLKKNQEAIKAATYVIEQLDSDNIGANKILNDIKAA